jgi:seryl-tRNA synthetase
MRILLTVKEYAKLRGLSDIAVYKRVKSNYSKSIKIDNETYIIQDDTLIQKLKQTAKNKNGQIRELKLKIKVKNNSEDERYINELIKQIEDLKETAKEQKEDIKKLLDQKDTMYEKFLGTLVNQKSLTQ